MTKTATSILIIACVTCFASCTSEDVPPRLDSGSTATKSQQGNTTLVPTVAIYHREKNVVFTSVHGENIEMDIFVPTGTKNGLAIVNIINEGFESNHQAMKIHEMARIFETGCRHGYTVFAVRTGSLSTVNAPEMLACVNQGIDWVKQHADQYGVDANRIGMMGASSGGYLACLAAATAEESSSVRAVAVLFPLTDFLNFRGQTVDVREDNKISKKVRQFLFPKGIDDLTDGQIEDRMRQFSPIHQLQKHCPPFLFIHGNADLIIPIAQSKKMHDALTELGVESEMIVKDGGGHAWMTIADEVKLLFDWFDETLTLQTP